MLKLFNKISEVGIDPFTDPSEIRYIKTTNTQTLFFFLFTTALIAQATAFLPHTRQLIIQFLVFSWGSLLVFPLQRSRFYVLARFHHSFCSMALISMAALQLGRESESHLYLVVAITVSFFIHKNIIHGIIVAFVGFIAFAGLEYYFIDHGPLIIAEPQLYLTFRIVAILNLFLILSFVTAYNFRFVQQKEKELVKEREKVESLLLNILPATIADRLKHKHEMIADHFEEATVLFADIVGFTTLSQNMHADELIHMLNDIFSRFDKVTKKYGLEKIKTIGDSYMVAGGVPIHTADHCRMIAEFACDINGIVANLPLCAYSDLKLRIGIHTGPVVAGVIGKEKFIYDLWGDTVNTASRMESHSRDGRIHVTEEVHEKLKDRFNFEYRGEQVLKGKGTLRTYFLLSRKDESGHMLTETNEMEALEEKEPELEVRSASKA